MTLAIQPHDSIHDRSVAFAKVDLISLMSSRASAVSRTFIDARQQIDHVCVAREYITVGWIIA